MIRTLSNQMPGLLSSRLAPLRCPSNVSQASAPIAPAAGRGMNPPGGSSQISFGDYGISKPAPTPPQPAVAAPEPPRYQVNAASYYQQGPAVTQAPVVDAAAAPLPSIVAGARPLYQASAAPFGTDHAEKDVPAKGPKGGVAVRPSQVCIGKCLFMFGNSCF